MWKIVHAHSDELDVIKDAMEEGFEPFAVDGGIVFLRMQVNAGEASVENRCQEKSACNCGEGDACSDCA